MVDHVSIPPAQNFVVPPLVRTSLSNFSQSSDFWGAIGTPVKMYIKRVLSSMILGYICQTHSKKQPKLFKPFSLMLKLNKFKMM